MRRPRPPVSILLAAGWLVATAAGCDDDPRRATAASTQSPASSASSASSASPPSSASSAPPATTAAASPDGTPDGAPSRGEAVDLAPPPEEEPDPRGAVGARVASVRTAAEEIVVAQNLALFEGHYGGAVPFPLERREAAVAGRRRALLFTSARAGDRPLVVLADAAGRALWHKERPLAGTHELSRGLTLTAGPGGAVLLFWWDVTSRAVAGRHWGHDGSIFADYHLFDAENVSGLDALHAPGRGWVVTVTSGTTARSVMLSETGFRGFGAGVVDVGGPHEVLSAATASAGVDGVFFAYVGRDRVPGNGPAHLWVTFRREDGSAPWPKPVDLGLVAIATDGTWPPPRLEPTTPALVRATVGAIRRTVSSDGRIVADR